MPPEIDALAPENLLIFATGPLTGTRWPSCGRLEVIAKSPLTDAYGDANAGGHFTPQLRFAGYDMVVFTGRATEPVYLWIDDDNVELCDAAPIWGLDTLETEAKLREVHDDTALKVAAIGPAGEHCVRFASIQVTRGRSVARAGMGAVMGSKRLKALAVRGTSDATVHAPNEFNAVAKSAMKKILADEFTPGEHKYGTPQLVNIVNEVGRFPTKNMQQGHFDEADAISGETLHEKYFVKHLSCYRCPIACDKLFRIEEGEYAGLETTSLEYETLSSLGSRCMNANLGSIMRANVICDTLGMDTISAGGVISFAMECWDEGIIGPEDTGGLDLGWGRVEAILSLLEDIAHRRGFGDLLAEGSTRAAKKLGEGAERYVMAIKGVEISAQDGRAQQSMGLAQATSTRGADHLKGFPTIDETGYPGAAIERYGEEYMPEIIDGTQWKYKAMVVKDGEEFCAVIDSIGICKFGTMFPPALYWAELAEALHYATGLELDADKLKEIGERINTLQRCYNALHGLTRADDRQPDRLLEEPSPSKRAKGHVIYLDKMLDEYYALRGWDPQTGWPTRETLERLDLDFAAERLEIE